MNSMSSSENERLKDAKDSLVRVLSNRLDDFYSVKGKNKGKDSIQQVLVDFHKRKQFLECSATGSIVVEDYGIYLEGLWQHDTPQSFNNRIVQFYDDFSTQLVVVKLQKEGHAKTYYMMSNLRKDTYIMSASFEYEIKHFGKFLYSTSNEDPAESFSHIIEQVYFGFAERHSCAVDNNKLFDAVRTGDLQTVVAYLQEGGDINAIDEYGRSLLHHAALCGNMDMIRFLKGKGANVQAQDKMQNRKPVHIAAKEGHIHAISFFLKNGSSINEKDQINWTPLHNAVFKGHLDTVTFLVEHGADVNAEDVCVGKKPIHIAAERGYTDVLKYLLENGAKLEDGDMKNRTPLYYAVWAGYLETSKFLICRGADVNVKDKQDKSLLHPSILSNDKENIEFFLDSGLNINEKDINGMTPLFYAAYNNKLDMLKILLHRGADLFAVDNDGKTPLVFSERHPNIVLYLAYQMCKKLQEEENYNEALKLYSENLEIIKKLGQENSMYLAIKNEIGFMLYKVGQFDEAEITLKDVLRNREICLVGSNNFETLGTKHVLGLVNDAQLKYHDAMNVFKEVFEARTTSLGATHDSTLNVSRDIANVHFKCGKYDEAFEVFKDVFEKRSKNFGSDHPKTLQARQDMAVIFVNKGDFKRALHIFTDVLEKRKLLLGHNHPDTLYTSYHVALTSRKVEKKLQKQSCCIL